MKYTLEQEEIFKFVMGYVDEADKHNVDKNSVLSEIHDIIDKCEDLAMDIESGEHELIDDRNGVDDLPYKEIRNEAQTKAKTQ